MLRLNIGNSSVSFTGYKNIDDIKVAADGSFKLKDIKDNSVCAVKLHYVLETLGSDVSHPSLSSFLKELYRVCRHGAVIEICANHANFLSGHMVPEVANIVNEKFLLNFDKTQASQISHKNYLPFALKHDVDFKLIKTTQEFSIGAKQFLNNGQPKTAEDFISVFSDPNAVEYCTYYLMCNKRNPEDLSPDLYAVTHWPDIPNFAMRLYDLNRGSMFGSRGIKTYGVWEPHVTTSFNFILQRLDVKNTPVVFANIGANLGWYTLFAAISTKNFKVDAFEPTPETLDILNENIELNDVKDRVHVHTIALSDSKGEAEFFIDNDNAGSNSLMLFEEGKAEQQARNKGVEGHQVIKVKTDTLDSVYLNQPRDKWPTVILMDVEGHEQKVLDGAKELFNKGFRPIILVEFSPVLMKLRGACTYYSDLISKFGYSAFITNHELTAISKEELDAYYKELSSNNAEGSHLDLLFMPNN